MSKLTGSVSGSSRRDVVDQAEALAGAYFGTACVGVRLHGERVDDIDIVTDAGGRSIKETVKFAAEFEAQENHVVEVPAYGFGRCRRCGRQEGAGSTLPRAVWSGA